MRSAPPESIVGCHLPDQRDCLVREPRLARVGFRFVLPVHTEELTMEAAEASPAGRYRAPVSRSEPFWREIPGVLGLFSGTLVV